MFPGDLQSGELGSLEMYLVIALYLINTQFKPYYDVHPAVEDADKMMNEDDADDGDDEVVDEEDWCMRRSRMTLNLSSKSTPLPRRLR